jgi:hypothetical protein
VVVDASIEGLGRMPTQILHELISRQNPPRILGQDEQKFELMARQRSGIAVDSDNPSAAIDFEPAETE